jgi:hypothetical protein
MRNFFIFLAILSLIPHIGTIFMQKKFNAKISIAFGWSLTKDYNVHVVFMYWFIKYQNYILIFFLKI